MRLADYLSEDLVVYSLSATHRDGLLDAIGAHLEENGLLPSGAEAARALKAREEAHTTVLGEGMAVPHATLPTLSEMILLVVRTPDPIAFGPTEAGPVDLFFVLLSPPGSEGKHIKLLARICRLARHPGLLEELREANGREALLRTILRVDSEHV